MCYDVYRIKNKNYWRRFIMKKTAIELLQEAFDHLTEAINNSESIKETVQMQKDQKEIKLTIMMLENKAKGTQ